MTRPTDEQITRHVSLFRVLGGVLMMGVVIITGVITYVVSTMKQPVLQEPIVEGMSLLSMIAIGVFIMNVSIATWVAPMIFSKRSTVSGSPPMVTGEAAPSASHPMLGKWTAMFLVQYGLVEGSCMFAMVAYFLERELYVLCISGLGLLVMLYWFPSVGKIARWVDTQIT